MATETVDNKSIVDDAIRRPLGFVFGQTQGMGS